MKSLDIAKLILRVVVGGLMLFHGVDKLIHGIGGIENMLVSRGWPAFIAYGVYIGEIVAPVMLIFGVRTRLAAIIFAFNMAVATYLAHSGDFMSLGDHGAWALELQAFYFFGAVVIALIGGGKLSFSSKSRWD